MNMKNIFVILFGLVMLFNLNFATPDIMVNGSDPCYEGVTTNYSTITEAVAAASDGESIIVCANGTIEDGIYVEDAIGIGTAIFIYGNESGVRFQTNDGEVGFVIQSANVNVTNFSISSNGAYGIAVDNKDNATIYDVTINGSTYGIYVTGANYSNLTSNTIYDTTSTGIYLNTSTHDHTVTSNTIYNTDGIYLEASVANTTLLYNYIYNTSTYGIGMGEVSTGNNFTSNNITNSTYGFRLSNAVVVRFSGQVMNNATYGIDLTNSSLNFSGNNEINTIPADGMPVYLDNSTINTGSYYITTDYFRFGLGETTDVSVQLVNLSNISDEDYTTMSTLSGVTAAYKKVVQSLQNNYYGLNVTNTSGSASFSPKLYYNDSDISFPYSNTYAGLGATSTLGAWTYYSPTTSVAGESVAYTGLSITAAAYFASIVYAPPVSSSTSSKSKGTIILTYELTCKDGTVSVYAKEASEELSGVKIILL
ncbi:MAG: right-handed parallel beta-helix repeat-containing protein, partial [Candidatus Micrarchaeia archaeon]